MVQTNISLTEKQHRWLQEHAQERGLSMAEVIRRAVDSYEAVQESEMEPGSDRAKYVQFASEHMGELVAAVLEGLGSEQVRELLRRGQGERIRQLEERGELGDWLLEQGEFQGESKEREQPKED